ncbi:MAG: DNA polymerase III subunit delta [Candidatus Cloacimonetes bacterium]|nr:DNA polymerase III subunit delta [Candidatus Cloacimonadota bacterium]
MSAKKVYRHHEFLSQLNSLKSQPLFYIFGGDQYLKDTAQSSLIEMLKTPEMDVFDFIILYGDTCSSSEILEQLEMPPMIASRRLIILRNLEMMKPLDRNKLQRYLESPEKSSTFIVVSDKMDGRQKLIKTLMSEAVCVECKEPYGSSDIARWLNFELRKLQIDMDREAVEIFANTVETDYLIAANELEKLIIFTRLAKHISVDDVLAAVGKSKTNSIFELQNSLGVKDLPRSILVLENLIANDEPGVYIITMLTRFFNLLWRVSVLKEKGVSPDQIKREHLTEVYPSFRQDYLNFSVNFRRKDIPGIFSHLLQADTELKSTDIKGYIILEKLIYNLCKGNS